MDSHQCVIVDSDDCVKVWAESVVSVVDSGYCVSVWTVSFVSVQAVSIVSMSEQ